MDELAAILAVLAAVSFALAATLWQRASMFGLSSSPRRVHASVWLLEAPDSLIAQSRRNRDGTGLGYFSPSGDPVLDKQPLAAFEDMAFGREARHVSATTFVSDIRYATAGRPTLENTHLSPPRCTRNTYHVRQNPPGLRLAKEGAPLIPGR
jgi:hypothetical protein